MTFQEAETVLRQLQKELSYYTNIRRTLEWDMRVNMPPAAAAYRGDCIGFLASRAHELTTSPEMEEAARTVLDCGTADAVLQAVAARALSEAQRYAAIPRKLHADYAAHCLKAELVWQEARAKNDFYMFCGTLDASFDYKRRFAAAAGHGDDVVTYLLNERESGLTEGRMDAMLKELKEFLIPFVRWVDKRQGPESAARDGCYPKERQKALCQNVMKAIGYDFSAGRLDESAHPVTNPNQRGDIRVTTRFFENDFTRGLISCCHETGHGLYHQNISPELDGTVLDFSASPGLDEGIGRFWENMIARSRPFWQWLLPAAKELFPSLTDVTPEEIYRSVNTVQVSANRSKTDEVTGSLHIILRYEVEKLLLKGEITAADVPAVWNQKSMEYFGSAPARDADGCLLDMHWASGFIAYFQSYILANFYDGHFLRQLQKELPEFGSCIARGEFAPIAAWQEEHIFRHGALYSANELLKKATGEDLSPQPYIRYLREKYSELLGMQYCL